MHNHLVDDLDTIAVALVIGMQVCKFSSQEPSVQLNILANNEGWKATYPLLINQSLTHLMHASIYADKVWKHFYCSLVCACDSSSSPTQRGGG